jgi:hypothetical protein
MVSEYIFWKYEKSKNDHWRTDQRRDPHQAEGLGERSLVPGGTSSPGSTEANMEHLNVEVQ